MSFNAWYPILFEDQLKINKIHPFKLLDEPLLAYQDSTHNTHTLQDRCAHRSTPLSLGRIVDDNIECLYHGWQFSPKGKCVKIPARQDDRNIPENCSVKNKTVLKKHDMIWVYQGDQTPAATLPYSDYFIDSKDTYRFDYSIDLKIPHELMIENLLDPAHLPFAHHGTLSKREKACPINFEVETNDSIISGVATSVNKKKKSSINFYFIPPHAVCFEVKFGNKAMRQLHFCLPLTQNTMRLNSIFFYNNMPWLKWIPFIKTFQKKMSKKIVTQDIAMLKGQEDNIKRGASPWNHAINADKMALTYRQWLHKAEIEKSWFHGY